MNCTEAKKAHLDATLNITQFQIHSPPFIFDLGHVRHLIYSASQS